MTQRCQMFQVDLHPEGGALCTLEVCSCKPSPSQPHLLHVSCACDARKVNIGGKWSEIWSPLKSRLRQCSTWIWELRRGAPDRFIRPQTLDRWSSRTARGEMGFWMTTITARQLINLAVDYYYLGDGSDFFISRVELHSRLLNSLGQLQNLTIRNVGKLVIQVLVILISLLCYCAFLTILAMHQYSTGEPLRGSRQISRNGC